MKTIESFPRFINPKPKEEAQPERFDDLPSSELPKGPEISIDLQASANRKHKKVDHPKPPKGGKKLDKKPYKKEKGTKKWISS